MQLPIYAHVLQNSNASNYQNATICEMHSFKLIRNILTTKNTNRQTDRQTEYERTFTKK